MMSGDKNGNLTRREFVKIAGSGAVTAVATTVLKFENSVDQV